MTIKIKRIYENPETKDGVRILVDRLWPRGLRKEDASLDYWFKEIAPSDKLRIDFHSGRIDFKGFENMYKKELRDYDKKSPAGENEILKIMEIIKKNDVSLLFGLKNLFENNASVLKNYIESKKGD